MKTAAISMRSEISSDTSCPTEMAADSSLDRPPARRVLVVVSRFNEAVTRRLLEGAMTALGDAGYAKDSVDGDSRR